MGVGVGVGVVVGVGLRMGAARHRKVGEVDAAIAVEVDRGVPARACACGVRVASRARPTHTGWVR